MVHTALPDASLEHALVVRSVRRVCPRTTIRRPLFQSRVPAGWPSPADDYVERFIDLNEELVDDDVSTFFVRVRGRSMRKLGIHDGDTLVVDRSVEPTDGSVIVAALDGELTVKRYRVVRGQPCLVPESDEHDPIPIREGQELVVWGVARHVIHSLA